MSLPVRMPGVGYNVTNYGLSAHEITTYFIIGSSEDSFSTRVGKLIDRLEPHYRDPYIQMHISIQNYAIVHRQFIIPLMKWETIEELIEYLRPAPHLQNIVFDGKEYITETYKELMDGNFHINANNVTPYLVSYLSSSGKEYHIDISTKEKEGIRMLQRYLPNKDISAERKNRHFYVNYGTALGSYYILSRYNGPETIRGGKYNVIPFIDYRPSVSISATGVSNVDGISVSDDEVSSISYQFNLISSSRLALIEFNKSLRYKYGIKSNISLEEKPFELTAVGSTDFNDPILDIQLASPSNDFTRQIEKTVNERYFLLQLSYSTERLGWPKSNKSIDDIEAIPPLIPDQEYLDMWHRDNQLRKRLLTDPVISNEEAGIKVGLNGERLEANVEQENVINGQENWTSGTVEERHPTFELLQEEFANDKRLVIAGGAALGEFAGYYNYKDIDLFVIGDNDDIIEIVERITRMVLNEDPQAENIFTENEQSYSTVLRTTQVQVIKRQYRSLAHILLGFDIDPAQVGYYMGLYYTTERARYSLLRNLIVFDVNVASTSYIYRLRKYLYVKEFDVYLPPSTNAQPDMVFTDKYRRYKYLNRPLIKYMLTQDDNKSTPSGLINSDYSPIYDHHVVKFENGNSLIVSSDMIPYEVEGDAEVVNQKLLNEIGYTIPFVRNSYANNAHLQGYFNRYTNSFRPIDLSWEEYNKPYNLILLYESKYPLRRYYNLKYSQYAVRPVFGNSTLQEITRANLAENELKELYSSS